MNPNLWGPCFWFILHTITLYYPDHPSYANKRHYFEFFHNLQYIIPCNICKKNYKQHLKDFVQNS